jgi:hypothetical protein
MERNMMNRASKEEATTGEQRKAAAQRLQLPCGIEQHPACAMKMIMTLFHPLQIT